MKRHPFLSWHTIVRYDGGAEGFYWLTTKDECRKFAEHILRENDSIDDVFFKRILAFPKLGISITFTKKGFPLSRFDFPDLVKKCQNCKWCKEGSCTRKIAKKYKGSDESRPCYDDYSEEYYLWNLDPKLKKGEKFYEI